jgi:hypothetical protein
MRFLQRLSIGLVFFALPGLGLAASPDISSILEKLASVHSIGEVAISPDGKQVIYGTSITGRRGRCRR